MSCLITPVNNRHVRGVMYRVFFTSYILDATAIKCPTNTTKTHAAANGNSIYSFFFICKSATKRRRLAYVSFAAFGKGVHLVSGSP